MIDFPSITILIPCRNEVRFIEDTIDKIFLSDYPSDKIEVIVADGYSDDGSYEKILELQKKYPGVKAIRNEKRTTPFAFNIGLAHGTGDYYMTLGSRHVLDKDYIKICVTDLLNNDDIVCCGGISESIHSNDVGKYIAKAMSSPIGVGMGNFRTINESKFVDTVGTPVYKRWIFEKIGWFDENLVRNQDDELNFRVTRAGYKIYLDKDAHVSYYARESFTKLYKQYFQYGYWKVYVNKKHKHVTSLRQLFPALFILSLIVPLLLCLFYFPFIYLALCSLAVYIMLVGYYIIKLSRNFKEIINIFIAILCLHFGYGLGYLQGIFHFLIINRNPSVKATVLTR